MHHLSLSVCPLRLFRRHQNGEKVGDALGTGFLWKRSPDFFLVTNWHNVTGRNSITGDFLGSFAPNFVTVGLKTVQREESGRTWVGSFRCDIPIRSGDEEPLWLEHPSGREVDCVLLPIKIPNIDRLANKMANECDYEARYTPTVGDDCFIVGYPKGVMGRVETPIWKRASIATEPALDHEHRPMFLVDSATRPGMSGSPVVVRHSGFWSPAAEMADDSTFGNYRKSDRRLLWQN